MGREPAANWQKMAATRVYAGTIKDAVTRYAHQSGHYVSRRAGWDCHGLPVEYEIDQALKIKHRDDVLEMGIKTYNQHCRSIVTRYSKEWEVTIKRLGRWIDFQNDYKTMVSWFSNDPKSASNFVGICLLEVRN